MAFVQDEPQEAEAFLHFLNTFELSRPLANISDLSDGLALFEILSVVCVRLNHMLYTIHFLATTQ